jgi:hypothetical protein
VGVPNNDTVAIGWELTRKPGEEVRISVKKGTKTIASQTTTNSAGKFNVKKSDGYTLELRDKSGTRLGVRDVTIESATSSDTQQTAAANTGCYKFKGTLFDQGNTEGVCAPTYLRRFYVWAVTIAIIGAAGMIIYAGYKYTMSQGNPTEITGAKEIIISTLLGLALLLLSFTILKFLGVNIKPTDDALLTNTQQSVP